MAECRQRLSIASSGRGVASYVLAGHTADGEIRLLIANASDRPARWRLECKEGKRIAGLHIEEVSDEAGRVLVRNAPDSGAHTPPDSVQLVRLILE